MPVSNSVDDRSGQPDETTIERGNPLDSEIPEWLQEFRDSHASSSHEVSLEPTFKRREDLGKHSVYTLISLKTEIARSVEGPKLQGPHAEDAMAEPHFVLKILVT